MKQSFVIVSEIAEDLLKKDLMDFANLYTGEQFAQDIMLYKEKRTNKFLVLFSNAPGFDHFCFAVNYLRYTKTPDITLPTVRGYYLNESNENSFLTKGFVKIYVASDDKEYDNVNVVISNNETYRFDFGGNQKKLNTMEQSFEVPEINIDNYNHVLNIIPSTDEGKPWWKIW